MKENGYLAFFFFFFYFYKLIINDVLTEVQFFILYISIFNIYIYILFFDLFTINNNYCD